MLVLCVCTRSDIWTDFRIFIGVLAMNCNVQTGYAVGATVSSSGSCLVASPGKVILFSPTTLAGTDRSAPFTITPGMAVLIDAYNLAPDLHVYVNRLVVTSDCITTGVSCNDADMRKAGGSAPTVVFRERMTLGNKQDKWSLIKNSDERVASRCQLYISMPGTYELELEDASVQLNGTMEIEYQAFKVADVGHLPASYYGGID